MAYNYNNNNNNLFYNTSNNKNTFNNKINSDKDFSGEPILVYDSFYSDSDDQEKGINNKNKKNLTKKKGKNKGTFYKITKQEKDQKKMDEDNNAMLQRVGSRRKTIVVQDETGKELSRIVSSTGNQDPNLMRRASFLAPPPMYPQPFTVQASQPPQFYSQPQPYPQPQLIMQAPPPPYQAPILVRAPAPQTVVLDNSYFTQRGSILNQIQEEPIKNDKRVKSSIINAINVTNSNKIIDAETLEAKHKTKFKVNLS